MTLPETYQPVCTHLTALALLDKYPQTTLLVSTGKSMHTIHTKLAVMLHIQVILPHCTPISRVVIIGSRNSASADSLVLLPSNSFTTALCWAFACLASLSFLRLGGELKANTVGMASGFSVRLNGPKLSRTDKT